MTIGELISKLQAFDPQAVAVIERDGEGFDDLDDPAAVNIQLRDKRDVIDPQYVEVPDGPIQAVCLA